VSPGVKGEVTIVEPDRIQRAIARRSAEARATVPDLELSAVVELEFTLQDLVRACALALRDVPRANGAYRDGRYELYSRVNIGVTLMSEDVHVIPTIFDADEKTADQIANELEGLRARSTELLASELTGATFTVSDLRPFGISSAAPIVIAPQAAALAVGAAGASATLTLACDHRILYGAPAASFLGRIRERLVAGA
jgi:pyruvate dehydrogenase E2 component (dihydrolipoamide acetyltransferase)